MIEKHESPMNLERLTFPDDLIRADYVVICLHGRNANKHAFLPFVRQMHFLHSLWILPTAPFQESDASDEAIWFSKTEKRIEELTTSRGLIHHLIDETIDAIDVAPENVFLLGFSQGAVMVIDSGLRYHRRLGGLLPLSGFVVYPEQLAEERHPSNARVPVFLGYGRRDKIVTVDTGRESYTFLNKFGYDIEYHEYESAHRISSHETRDIRGFLHRHMYGISLDDPRSRDEHIVQF